MKIDELYFKSIVRFKFFIHPIKISRIGRKIHFIYLQFSAYFFYIFTILGVFFPHINIINAIKYH